MLKRNHPEKAEGEHMLVSVAQASRVLGISIKTIERAITTGAVPNRQPAPAPQDLAADPAEPRKSGPRYYLVDLAEVRDYFTARGTLDRVPRPADAEIIHQLLDECEALKHELARLRGENSGFRDRVAMRSGVARIESPAAPVSGVTRAAIPEHRAWERAPSSRQHVTHAPSHRRTTQVPNLPEGLFAITAFARQHGGYSATALKKQIARGHFQVEGPYKVGRQVNIWAVDYANAQSALRLWVKRGRLKLEEMTTDCPIPRCICAAVRTAIESEIADGIFAYEYEADDGDDIPIAGKAEPGVGLRMPE
jgi:hypothetical protein